MDIYHQKYAKTWQFINLKEPEKRNYFIKLLLFCKIVRNEKCCV